MCRHFGATIQLSPQVFHLAGVLSAWENGDDGWGVASLKDDGTFEVIKSEHAFYRQKMSVLDMIPKTFMLHVRQKSTGMTVKSNSHPYIFTHFAGAHNGTMTGWADAYEDYFKKKATYMASDDQPSTDSWHALAILDDMLNTTEGILNADVLNDWLNMFKEGSKFVFSLLDKQGNIHLIRHDAERHMFINEVNGGFVYSTTNYPVIQAESMGMLKVKQSFEMPQHTWITLNKHRLKQRALSYVLKTPAKDKWVQWTSPKNASVAKTVQPDEVHTSSISAVWPADNRYVTSKDTDYTVDQSYGELQFDDSKTKKAWEALLKRYAFMRSDLILYAIAYKNKATGTLGEILAFMREKLDEKLIQGTTFYINAKDLERIMRWNSLVPPEDELHFLCNSIKTLPWLYHPDTVEKNYEAFIKGYV